MSGVSSLVRVLIKKLHGLGLGHKFPHAAVVIWNTDVNTETTHTDTQTDTLRQLQTHRHPLTGYQQLS